MELDDEPDLNSYAEMADVGVEQARLCYEGLIHQVFELRISFEEAKRLMFEAYPTYELQSVFHS